MIKNYLLQARNRFEKDKELKKKKGDDPKQKVAEPKRKDQEKITVQCISPGCTMYGTDETSYLCSACYARQKQEALNLQNSQTVQKDTKSNLVTINYTDPVIAGKSKFYARTDEIGKSDPSLVLNNKLLSSTADHKTLQVKKFYNGVGSPELHRISTNRTPPPDYETTLVNRGFATSPSHSPIIHVKGLRSVPVQHVITDNLSSSSPQRQQIRRSESPRLTGYDNLDWQMDQQLRISSTPTKKVTNVPSARSLETCRTQDCPYYGSVECNYFCTDCYKQYDLSHLEAANRQTRL